jgi:GST-like protein
VTYRLLACRHCGSSIVEAAFVLAGIPYEREEANYDEPAGRARLLEFNPLAQVPTLIMPDGSVMTESAAIIIHLDTIAPEAALVARGPQFLRWLMFLVTTIYPTFTYGDDPKKWTASGAEELRNSTNAHREAMWRYVEQHVQGPWFLGEHRSALDLYVSVMTRWRPRREWFAKECPKLHAVAVAVDADARLAPVWAANFD